MSDGLSAERSGIGPAEHLLQQALAHHRGGRLGEAEAIYRGILQGQPGHADANHNLGLLLLQGGQAGLALGHLKVALQSNAGQVQYWVSYIEALIRAGQIEAARQMLAQGRGRGLGGAALEGLAARLQAAEAGLGGPTRAQIEQVGALFEAARFAELEGLARELTLRYPEHGLGWHALGGALKQLGKSQEALAPLHKAVALLPADPGVHCNLGILLQDLGRLAEAEASFRQGVQIRADFAPAHGNLGNVLREQGRLAEAEASLRRALEIAPAYAEAHNNLGLTLQGQGRGPQAEASLRQALALKPEYFQAHANLGAILQEQGRLSESEAGLRRALELKPDFAAAHSNLGTTLLQQGRLSEAEASYRRALELEPDFEDAFGNLLFVLNYDAERSAQEIFAGYRDYEERFGVAHRGAWQAHGNSRERGRRLKVGYVSPDFRQHAVRHFLEPLLACHDKAGFEVYAYAQLRGEDAVTGRYRGYVEHWVATAGLSDAGLAERIRADGIDILVDLAGHTAGNRLQVFARKPAPVSVSWLGYGYTTGLKAIDYFLTDEASAPAGSEELFSERPWRLATPCYVYRPDPGMGEVSELPALERGAVTFGTLTRAVRINQRTLRVWSEILKRLPGARLVIDSGNFRDPAMQHSLAQRFAAHGIDPARLQIGFHSPPWELLRGMDIGLDCFPHNSGTTLFETLYMGVPYVSLAGRPSVGRLGGCVLQAVGHPEWIARTEEDYVEKAVALASELPKLAALRGQLRAQMQASPLMDEAGFARKVETAYREMFAHWARQPAGQ